MSQKSEKITEVLGSEQLPELAAKVRENFDLMQRFIDGITGQRLEPWTAVLRDGSVPMTGNLVVGGELQLGDTALRSVEEGRVEYRPKSGQPWGLSGDYTVCDVTASRGLGIVYRNRNKTRICQITLKLEAT